MYIDPTAMISNSLSSLLNAQCAMQQAQMQAQMQQYAMQSQSNALANSLGGLSGLQNAAGQMQALQSYGAVPSISSTYARAKAEFYAEGGDRLIRRLDFLAEWLTTPVLGFFAKRRVASLVAALDATTDEVERWLKMAEPNA